MQRPEEPKIKHQVVWNKWAHVSEQQHEVELDWWPTKSDRSLVHYYWESIENSEVTCVFGIFLKQPQDLSFFFGDSGGTCGQQQY